MISEGSGIHGFMPSSSGVVVYAEADSFGSALLTSQRWVCCMHVCLDI